MKPFEEYQKLYSVGLAKLGNELIAMRVGSQSTFEINGYGPGSIWQKIERIQDVTGMQFQSVGYGNNDINNTNARFVIIKRES